MGPRLYADRVIPFLDISTRLQTVKDDCNCGLYGLTMIAGILKILD